VLLSARTATQEPRTLALDDYLAIHSVSDVTTSPDGRHAVYVVRDVDMAADKRTSRLWRVAIDGGAPERLTQTGSASSPLFSPDGRDLAVLSDRSGRPTACAWRS
jgi:dipeptidyl aminopeptidase/acylaminoacyl peptidase